MPKSQFIDPKTVRKKGWIKFEDIAVNAYDKTIEEEKGKNQDLALKTESRFPKLKLTS